MIPYQRDKITWRFATVLCVVAMPICGCSKKPKTKEIPEIERLIQELNEWDSKELVAYMESDSDRNYIVHEQSTFWIEEHIDAINDLGMEVKWIRAEKLFVLVPLGMGDNSINHQRRKKIGPRRTASH